MGHPKRFSVELSDATRKYIWFGNEALREVERVLGRSVMTLFSQINDSDPLLGLRYTDVGDLLYVGIKGFGGSTSKPVLLQKMHSNVQDMHLYVKEIYSAMGVALFGMTLDEMQAKAEEKQKELEEGEEEPSENPHPEAEA